MILQAVSYCAVSGCGQILAYMLNDIFFPILTVYHLSLSLITFSSVFIKYIISQKALTSQADVVMNVLAIGKLCLLLWNEVPVAVSWSIFNLNLQQREWETYIIILLNCFLWCCRFTVKCLAPLPPHPFGENKNRKCYLYNILQIRKAEKFISQGKEI